MLGFAGGIFALTYADEPYYFSRAAIWVERPTDLSGGAFAEFNPYASPAQNQASSMRELLGIKSFAQDILLRVEALPTAPLTVNELRTNAGIFPYGTHVLYIEYRSQSPLVAKQMVDAIVAAYTELYTSQIRDRALRSREFYEEQLSATRAAAEEASAALLVYLAEHPELAEIDLDNPPSLALTDIEFGRLLAADQAARDSYDQTVEKYADSQISANTVDGAIPNFLIMDEAEVPTLQIMPSKRSLIMPPMLGLMAGLLVSAIGFLVYWRLDRRIHLPGDLEFLGEGIPLMSVPFVRSRRRFWPARFVRVAAALNSGLDPAGLRTTG
jgi:uncharacterized protein involved in exopolysaccharide biosynthesis